MPEVSVIIPCHNAAPFLRECLQSVSAQTFPDWEIIAVDDCSTDGSPEILEEFAVGEPRARLIRHAENRGVSASRNDGLDRAAGRFVMFLDADDFLPPGAIGGLLDLQQVAGAALACGNGRAFLDGEKTDGDFFYPADIKMNCVLPQDADGFCAAQRVMASSCFKLFAREMIQENRLRFSPELSYGEDTLFVHAFALLGGGIAVDTSLDVYRYRQHAASAMHAFDLGRRLKNLETLVTAIRRLGDARAPGLGLKLARGKAAEYLWSVKKYGKDPAEKKARMREILQSAFFSETLYPALTRHGKFKHRLCLRLLAAGCRHAINWW